MLQTNPYATLTETVDPVFMQLFVFAMLIFVVVGTIIDTIHKKNVFAKYTKFRLKDS